MNRYFDNVEEYNCDVTIVDYTEVTKNSSRKRGVEFHLTKPEDIEGLMIVNNNNIEYFAVNFELNPLVDEDGMMIAQCESMCAAKKRDEDKGWLLLAELKYGLTKNDKSNFIKAINQVRSTYLYLNNRGVISNHRVYYIVSLPISDKRPPFESFVYTPCSLAEIKRDTGVIIRGTNKVEVRDSKRLKV